MRVVMVSLALLTWTCIALAGEAGWGVQAGVIAASVRATGQDAFDADAETGPAAGAFVSSDVERRVVLQGEMLLTGRRFGSTQVADGFHVSSRSIEVPLLLRLRAIATRDVRIWIDGGPQLSRIFSVTQRVGAVRSNISDQIKNMDAGVAFGAGAERRVGSGAVVVNTRVIVGLRNLSEARGRSLKSRAFTVLLGYRF